MAQVSVLLNVYNDEMFLEECIKSVLSQSFRDLELVIVNDGSTDGTLTIINKFKQKDSRVVLVDLSNNVGRAKAINTALQHAGGQYVAKLDSDDYFFPEKIERQVEYMERHKDCFLVACGVDMVDEKSNRILTVKPLQSSQEIAEEEHLVPLYDYVQERRNKVPREIFVCAGL